MDRVVDIRPVRLGCEHLTNPVGIDVVAPRPSWVLESDGRGKRQSAYQILVSDSEQELQEDKGTLWDSGKVLSDETIGVVYGGEKPRPGTRCFWKVRAWDEKDESSPYSGLAWW